VLDSTTSTVIRRPSFTARLSPPTNKRPPHPATQPATSLQRRPMPAATPALPPHPATVAQRRANTPLAARAPSLLQRMEIPKKCVYCERRPTHDNRDELCDATFDWPTVFAHEWVDDYSSSSNNNAEEKHSSVWSAPRSSLTVDKPKRYDEATTWLGLRTLIEPFATKKLRSGDDKLAPVCCTNFSSCAPTIKACELLCDAGSTPLEGIWASQRPKVIGDIGFTEPKKPSSTAKRLTHTGVLRAEVWIADKKLTWTFYASASNVCIVHGKVEWLVTGVTQSSSGSCHTEQLCMFWLHDELVRLQQSFKPTMVTLRWFTEIPMCDLWCKPALALFISHWQQQGLTIDSTADEVKHK
jgi:hypothetical protein